ASIEDGPSQSEPQVMDDAAAPSIAETASQESEPETPDAAPQPAEDSAAASAPDNQHSESIGSNESVDTPTKREDGPTNQARFAFVGRAVTKLSNTLKRTKPVAPDSGASGTGTAVSDNSGDHPKQTGLL